MIVALACCAALAVALGMRRPLVQRTSSLPRRRGPSLGDPRFMRIASAGAGLVVALVWGGAVGIAIGVLIAVLLPRWIGRLESRGARTRREALARQAAPAADLLAACLTSGAPLPASVAAVADAMGEPIARPLRSLVDSLELGTDPRAAWQVLAREEPLAPIARAAARSQESGAPLSEVLRGASADLRRAHHAHAEAAARASGVKAVGPLAACFLPAFLLIGIVPVVVSLALPLAKGTFGS